MPYGDSCEKSTHTPSPGRYGMDGPRPAGRMDGRKAKNGIPTNPCTTRKETYGLEYRGSLVLLSGHNFGLRVAGFHTAGERVGSI